MAADDLPLPPDGLSYYHLLGVTEDAPERDIERAYRQLVRHYHPDHFDHWAASDVTKRLRQARDTLTDPRARQRYNSEGHHEYTGEEPPPLTEVQDWLNAISDKVDVDNQVSADDVDHMEADTDDVAAAFDLTDIDVDDDDGTETIFEADADTPSSTDWGDVREEAADEHRDADPGYASEPDIDEIDPDPPPVEDNAEERTPVDLSHEERIKKKVESRSRKMDPEEVIRTDAPEDREEAAVQKREPVIESLAETGRDAYTAGRELVDAARACLADDVLSRAHRKAWRTRLVMVVIVFFAGMGVGEIAAMLGLTGLAEVFPRAATVLASPGESINIVLIAVAVVFIADQIKTERDTSRGRINVAGPPLQRIAVSVGINTVGLVLASMAVNSGQHPMRVLARLRDGTLPGAVWVEMSSSVVTTAVNTSIAVIMAGALIAGFALSFYALSRLVWYDRYCAGYHVLPLIWDVLLITPVTVAFWLLVTSARSFGLPPDVAAAVIGLDAAFMDLYGIHPTFITQDAAVLTALIAPTILAAAYLGRRTIEIGGRYLYTTATEK